MRFALRSIDECPYCSLLCSECHGVELYDYICKTVGELFFDYCTGFHDHFPRVFLVSLHKVVIWGRWLECSILLQEARLQCFPAFH